MKKKYLLAAFALGLSMSAKVLAQVPSNVPANGLVGYWPFNGNANDESGNGNNGTVGSGITLSTDRFSNANSAYNFTGNGYIQLFQDPIIGNSNFTISVWIKSAEIPVERNAIMGWGSTSITNGGVYLFYYGNGVIEFDNTNVGGPSASGSVNDNLWHQIIVVHTSGTIKLFIDGTLRSSGNLSPNIISSTDAYIGSNSGQYFFNGQLDDIAIYNRSLTEQEITTSYNGCPSNQITTQPINSVNTVGSNAQFSVNAVAGSAFQWQSNPLNTGWLNLSNNSTYSGATTNTLTVSNTTVSNHNQPFRAIVNAGGCIDTSNVAQILIGDTCLTTVTDTLIINTTLGLPAPNNANTILIYPNPASDHITIDNGNYTAMAGYTIKIENNAGQQVFQSLVNQAQFYVDLSTWSGNGLYFIQLIDAQGNTVTVRKIVLQ
jgi:hypothetical protein